MSTRSRFFLDVALFAAFVAASNPAVTGIAVHEWLCLLVIVPAIVHTVVNWEWVTRIATRFLDKIRAASRVNLLVDIVLFVATVAVMVSGFAVSRSLSSIVGLQASALPLWHSLHAFSADAVFALFVLHAALHWRWIVCAVRSMGSADRACDAPLSPVPVPVAEPVRSTAPSAPHAPNHFM